MVVAPTTAVPMSTGLAVALKVFPAPSFSSRRMLGRFEVDVEAVVPLQRAFDPGKGLDHRQLEHGLRVVGDGTVGVHRDRHRPHAEEAEGHQAEGEHRRREHERAEAQRAHQVRDAHEHHDDDPEPVGAEIAGDEAGEDVQRGPAFARRDDDFLHVASTPSR